jgi:hypothetical protein
MKSRKFSPIVSLFLLAAVWMFYLADHTLGTVHSPTTENTRSHRSSGSSSQPQHENHYPDERVGGSCEMLGVSCGSKYFATWRWPENGSCAVSLRNGYPIPDARCTPGGIVPNLTIDVLRDPAWRTKCIRNCQSSESQKHITYEWYGLPTPADNKGPTQVCELDHLVPLELGGADGLGNIWPECGPDESTLRDRYFKRKDRVEGYLAAKVRAGEMPLEEAQRGIAVDWTQYIDESAGFEDNARSRRRR